MKKTFVYGLLALIILSGIGLAGWVYSKQGEINNSPQIPGPATSTPVTSGTGNPTPTSTPTSPNTNGKLVLSGQYVAGGVECPLFEADNGKSYTLSGASVRNFKEGDRVRIEATVAEMSFCMQGMTLNVSKIEKI